MNQRLMIFITFFNDMVMLFSYNVYHILISRIPRLQSMGLIYWQLSGVATAGFVSRSGKWIQLFH